MTSRLRVASLGIALSILLVACGSTGSSSSRRPSAAPSGSVAAGSGAAPRIIPIQVTSAFRVGENRIVYTLTDRSQKQVAAPGLSLAIGYHGPNGETIASTPQVFIWAIEGVNGVYVGHATFPTAGAWTADFTTTQAGAPPETTTFGFDVRPKLDVVSPGDAAPSVDTPTLADVGGDVSRISTDAKPEKRFYETSVADALAAKKPFVLAFATPKFCRSATCGPTLEKVKQVAATHPELTFINVEPYQLKDDAGQLQPVLDAQGAPVPVEATNAFKLSTEPYVFVVGADGTVVASFELVFSPDEIEAAIKQAEGKS